MQQGPNINKVMKLGTISLVMIVYISFILNIINLYLVPWFILIKNKRAKSNLSVSSPTVQKGHDNCNVAPKLAYRPPIFVPNFA